MLNNIVKKIIINNYKQIMYGKLQKNNIPNLSYFLMEKNTIYNKKQYYNIENNISEIVKNIVDEYNNQNQKEYIILENYIYNRYNGSITIEKFRQLASKEFKKYGLQIIENNIHGEFECITISKII